MFQHLMDVGHQSHCAYVAAYKDDAVIHSPIWLDQFHLLQEMLSKLQKTGLMANPHKFHLGLTDLTRKSEPDIVRWTPAAKQS